MATVKEIVELINSLNERANDIKSQMSVMLDLRARYADALMCLDADDYIANLIRDKIAVINNDIDSKNAELNSVYCVIKLLEYKEIK